MSKQELQTSHTPAVNSPVGWKQFKIISLHSSASYSWVPDSPCFNSPFPNCIPDSELGEAQFHSGCTAWMQERWSLLSFPGQEWRMSFLIHLSLETLAPPGFLLVFPPFALCLQDSRTLKPCPKGICAILVLPSLMPS